jgi:hypothetical protein
MLAIKIHQFVNMSSAESGRFHPAQNGPFCPALTSFQVDDIKKLADEFFNQD